MKTESTADVRAALRALPMAALAAWIPLAHGQWAPPYLDLQRAGLVDAQHTDPGGYQGSSLVASSAGGHLVGTSYRFVGAVGVPQSAWIWTDAGGTTRLGYTDGVHTATDGSQSSTPRAVGADGRVAGVSLRYNGVASAGQSAWTWSSAGGLVRAGFTDAAHTAAGGSQFSESRALNDAGRAIGVSYRYAGSTFAGQSAWNWTPAAGTVRIGFIDSTHTSTTGVQYSDAVAVNNAGQVAGSSKRYSGSAERGESAWVWLSGVTTRIGLIDAVHTSSTGQQTSRPTGQSTGGQVIGTSARYTGPVYTGDSAWTWTPALGTVRVGLTDAGHIAASGSQYSTASALNAAGQVIGYSQRFNGAAETGQSAWCWSAADGTTRLGYTDAAHTGSAGYQYSAALRLGSAGTAIGYSMRYNAGASAGTSAWSWTGASGLVPLGLVDAAHTRADGYRGSWPIAVNASGQVMGTSERYNGGPSTLGNDGWFYDPATGVTTTLSFSSAEDGRVMTAPSLLTDSGWVLGNRTLYSGNTDLGYSAFVWSSARGYAPLGSLVDGGLASKGWNLLTNVITVRATGSIVGLGIPTGTTASSLGVFVLAAPPGPCVSADIGRTGGLPGPDGQLNNNDFIVFIDWFFAQNPGADRGVTGGVAGSDGRFDNNDFVVFIDQFFAAC